MARVKNYINNKTLFEAMVLYRNSVQKAIEEGKPAPQIPNYIGQSIIMICENLARKGNFSSYTYKLDMISDGIVDCVAAVDNFNPEKTNNPFAYFTMIAWNAFIRRITKEKKQTYIKHKNFENNFINNQLWDGSFNLELSTNEYSEDVIRSFEEKLTKIQKSSKIKGIEKFANGEIVQSADNKV